MFNRRNCKIAHRPDSFDGLDSPHPPCHTAYPQPPKLPKNRFHLRNRLQIPRLRIRLFASVVGLLRKMRRSCRRVLLLPISISRYSSRRTFTTSCSTTRPRPVGMNFAAKCTRSSCSPDDIADCIEFLKRSAAYSDSDSPPISS